MGTNEKAWHVGFKWTIGNEDVPAGAIAVDNTSKQLHICDIEDVGTDWNVPVDSYPSVYIHDITNPATDYIKMYHNGTNGIIDVDGTTVFTMSASAWSTLLPLTLTQSALGNDVRGVRFLFTADTPNMTDGYGAFETDLTVTGTATGHIAATSTWVNLGTSAVIPSFCEVHNDGVWDGTATLTNANISWARYHCLLSSNPAAVNLWSLNFDGANSKLDALFDVNNAELALGFTAGSPSASTVGSIPFFWVAGGAGGGPRYIHLHNTKT